MMINKIKNNLPIIILNIFLLVISSIFMYNMYKSLSGFIANGFRDGLLMIAMVSSYLQPVICYIFFFYKNYVKEDKNKVTNLIYSIIMILWSSFNIYSILLNMDIYSVNNSLGVYDALISLMFLTFPYDMMIINFILIGLQAFNIVMLFYKNNNIQNVLNMFKHYRYFKFNIFEYIALSILMILTFVFVGAFFTGFKAIENVTYDPRYLFLMFWVLYVPTSSLFAFIFKIEQQENISKNIKNIYLASLIGSHLLVTALLLTFERITPSFVVNIGKPLFAIAFSVSIAIEMIILLAISLLTVIYFSVRFIKINVKK